MKTIKGNQRGKGGARRGAGRKPGSANVRTREIANKAAAEGVTPLEYILKLMDMPCPEGADARTKVDVAGMRFEAAKAAAPYVHPRLATRGPVVKLGPLKGSLADQGRKVVDAMAKGDITIDEAVTVMQTLAAQAKVVEIHELETRLAALEEKITERNTRHG